MTILMKSYGIHSFVEEQVLVIDVTRGTNVNRMWDAEFKIILSDNAYLGHIHRVHYKPWTMSTPRPDWLEKFEIDMIDCIPMRVRLFR